MGLGLRSGLALAIVVLVGVSASLLGVPLAGEGVEPA